MKNNTKLLTVKIVKKNYCHKHMYIKHANFFQWGGGIAGSLYEPLQATIQWK